MTERTEGPGREELVVPDEETLRAGVLRVDGVDLRARAFAGA